MTCASRTQKVNIKVGLHQGSSLSLYIFDLIMDILKPEISQPTPWDRLSADDIVLIDTTRKEAEQKLEIWKTESLRLVERKRGIWF